jgi:hypothetical protein
MIIIIIKMITNQPYNKERKMKIRIEELRRLANDTHEVVDSWEGSSTHRRRAGAAYAAMLDSVRESGLRGSVRVLDATGKRIEVLAYCEHGTDYLDILSF